MKNQKKKKTLSWSLQRIDWLDAAFSMDNTVKGPVLTRSVGFVVVEARDHIKLAQTVYPERGFPPAEVLVIPKKMIKGRRVFR